MNVAEKIAERRRAAHERACQKGEHKWMLVSEDSWEYSYSSTGGGNPTYTERIYECEWCGERTTETEGDEYEWGLHRDAYGDPE